MPQQKPPDIMDDELNKPPDILDDTELSAKPINENEPDTWMKGFINSVTSGEALDTGLQGLKGYAKGAILDLPESIAAIPEFLKSGFELINPTQWYDHPPQEKIKSGIEMVKGMANLSSQAGARPEEFGRMMGQMTGQSIVGEGLLSGIPKGTFGSPVRIPSGINAAGAVTETVGKGLQNYPATGWVPFGRLAMPTNLRRMDMNLVSGPIGRGLENVGNRLRNFGKPPLQGEIVTDNLPEVIDGEYTIKGPKELPPSKVFNYGEQGLQEGQDIVPKNYKVIRNESVKQKPQIRANQDGTFTNLETGEVLDSKGQSIVEINGKSPKEWSDPIHKELEDILPKSDILQNVNLNKSLSAMTDQELVSITRLPEVLGGSSELATEAYTELIKRGKINGYPTARTFQSHNLNTGEIKEFDRATNKYRIISPEAPFAPESTELMRNSINDIKDISKADFRPDGTILDKTTGRVYSGEGGHYLGDNIPINPKNIRIKTPELLRNYPELDMNKTLDKNSPFFTRNRLP